MKQTTLTDLSVDKMKDLRERLFVRFRKFKNKIGIRGDILQKSKSFLYFDKDIDQFISLLDDLICAVDDEDEEDFENIQAKMCKHEDIESEVNTRGEEMNNLEELGLDLIVDDNSQSDFIRKKIYEMKAKWQILLTKLTDQTEILRTKQYYIDYIRSYEKIKRWIDKKMNFLIERNNFRSLKSIEQYAYEFSQIENKISRMESKIEEMKENSDFFIKEEFSESYNVSQKKESLVYSWAIFKDVLSSKRIQLIDFIRIHKLCCRVNEFLAWIARKDAFLSNEDCGKNLEEFLVLQKQHLGMERLLDEMELRYDEILDEHDSLCTLHQIHTEGILVDRHIIEGKWQDLELKSTKRRVSLQIQARIHTFLVDADSSIQTMDRIKSAISNEDLKKNERDAYSHLKLLSFFRGSIISGEEYLDDVVKRGQEVLTSGFRTDELIEKLEELSISRRSIHDLLDSQQAKYTLERDIQQFQLDCDVVANWLTQKETLLILDEDLLNSLDVVKVAVENHNQLKRTFDNEKIRMLSLINFQPEVTLRDNSTDQILQKRNELNTRLKSLEYSFEKRSNLLENNLRLQLFYTDCIDIEKWMIAKLQVIIDDYYLDGSIINSSILTHGLFLRELTDYSRIIRELLDRENTFIQEGHFASHVVKERVKVIVKAWIALNLETYDKTLVLDDILSAQFFLILAVELEEQLGEYEEILEHQYVFHDGELSRILKVEVNLENLERGVRNMKRRIDDMRLSGFKLVRNRHYDTENILKKMKDVCNRHWRLTCTIKNKLFTVKQAHKVGEVFMEMEKHATWINTNVSKFAVIYTEQGIVDVAKVRSKFKIEHASMLTRAKEIGKLTKMAKQMIARNHYDKDEIQNRLTVLLSMWKQMNLAYAEHVTKVREAKRVFNYYSEVALNEAIIEEKRSIMSNTDYGSDEDSSAALLNRHAVLVDDFIAYGKKIRELRKKALEWRITRKWDVIKEEAFVLVSSTKEEKRKLKEPSPKVSDSQVNKSVYICPLVKKQDDLEKLFCDVLNLAKQRKRNLENTHKAFALIRETEEMLSWIAKKEPFVREVEVGANIAEVEILQKKFMDFRSNLTEKKIELIGILTKTEKIQVCLQTDFTKTLLAKTEELKCGMKNIQELSREREKQLNSAHELQRFYKDLEEAEYWMSEKYEYLDNAECGDSLRAVRRLLRKHEGFQRDLYALDDKLSQLEDRSEYLMEKYSESVNEIKTKQISVNEMWEKISKRAILRKQDLLDHYDLQQFNSAYDDLMLWMHKMRPLVSNEDLATDVQNAELQKMNFERLCCEIDQRDIEIRTVKKFGETLCGYNSNALIQRKLDTLKDECQLLQKERINKRNLMNRNLEVNIFLRHCETMEKWLADKEVLLNITEENEQLIKIHRKLEKSLHKKKEKMSTLQCEATKLALGIQNNEGTVRKKFEEVILRWNNLQNALLAKRLQLKETQTLQKFSLETAEIESWIDEKLQQAIRETFRDPVKIKSKLLKHQAFEAEIVANEKRVETILDHGHELIETEKCEKLKAAVERRLLYITNQWDNLREKTKETTEKLKEVSKQYNHIMSIKYMNLWMSSIETLLMNSDLGKCLDSVQHLLEQHKDIGEDIKSHWKKIEGLHKEVDMFKEDSIFDIVSISEEHKNMITRFERIKDLETQRRARLEEKNTIFNSLKEIENTESWIRECALRMDETIQPKFECTRIQPTFKMTTRKLTKTSLESKAEERAKLIEKYLNLQ